jgi:hypothetical protein
MVLLGDTVPLFILRQRSFVALRNRSYDLKLSLVLERCYSPVTFDVSREAVAAFQDSVRLATAPVAHHAHAMSDAPVAAKTAPTT